MLYPASFLQFPGLLLAATLSAASLSAANSTPADALREAEALLLEDPERALTLGSGALELIQDDAGASWLGEDLSSEELRERLGEMTTVYEATESRLSFAAYCTDKLIGPDRLSASTQVARREARDGDIEAALSRADAEKLLGQARLSVMGEIADRLQTLGEVERMQEVLDEMIPVYSTLNFWEREMAVKTLADRMFAGERFQDIVALAYEMREWRSPYYLSLAGDLFQPDAVASLRDQAIGLAQQKEDGEQALALAEIAGGFAATGQAERAEEVAARAEKKALKAPAREKALAFAALAILAAEAEKEDEATAHFAFALETIMDEIEGWQKTDAFIELAASIAGTNTAKIAGPKLEESALVLAKMAGEDPVANKYRAYELLAVAAASSPADRYSPNERVVLFDRLLRLEAIPDKNEEEPEA